MSGATATRRRPNETGVSRLRDSLVARVRGDDSESGVALLSAIIFMIIMAGISVVLLSTVLAQSVPSVAAQRNTKTIYAAQAGVQASLAMLRSAAAPPDSAGNVFGALTQLKCSLTGRVDAQGNGLSYSAQISYYSSDPAIAPTPTPLGCTPTGGVVSQPKFAVIKSQGLAPAVNGGGATVDGSRAISATYTFKVSNVNIAGGRIFDGNNTVCLEAVPRPSWQGGGIGPGSVIKFVSASSCTSSATNDVKQLWVYDTDYEIKLASTTAVGSTSLCITGPATAGGDTQDATLQLCKAKTDAARWNQLWSWTGSYTWQGQNTDIASGYSSYNLAGPIASGNRLQVKKGGTDGTFNPASAVGAGAASVNTLQIVNYLEFGRCLDVTDTNINNSYMIAYPCKQDPSGTGTPAGTGKLDWNHKWYYKEPPAPATSLTQTISVRVNTHTSQTYGLPTPTTAGAIYPTFASCAGQDSQNWTRINDTNVYLDSYMFVDYLGRCLSVGKSSDLYKGWSKIVVATCDRSLAQKWNSPPASSGGEVGGYREYTP
jgi:hypothetical protein